MASLVDPPPSHPPTDRLYLPSVEGNFLYHAEGKLLSSTLLPSTEEDSTTKLDLIFDRSPFHPQGGGQPSDIGRIIHSSGLDLKVIKVSFSFETNIVIHHCEHNDSTPPILEVGETWNLQVDEDQRILFSKYHSAGHMVDAAMGNAGYNFPATKGYHFLDAPCVEYKGSVEAPKRAALIDELNEVRSNAGAKGHKHNVYTSIPNNPTHSCALPFLAALHRARQG